MSAPASWWWPCVVAIRQPAPPAAARITLTRRVLNSTGCLRLPGQLPTARCNPSQSSTKHDVPEPARPTQISNRQALSLIPLSTNWTSRAHCRWPDIVERVTKSESQSRSPELPVRSTFGASRPDRVLKGPGWGGGWCRGVGRADITAQ